MTTEHLDLTGNQYGKLKVIELQIIKGIRYWICECKCGSSIKVTGNKLLKRNQQSCRRCSNSKIEIGGRYGILTVEKYHNLITYPSGKTSSQYVCKCDCGNDRLAIAKNLLNGRSNNCGCLTSDKQKAHSAMKKEFGYSTFKRIYDGYRSNARKRNLTFDLELDRFKELVLNDCYYCGDIPSREVDLKNYHGSVCVNGVDRIDSKKGYEEGNIVSCCYTCNFMKLNYDIDFFLNHITKILSNRKMI